MGLNETIDALIEEHGYKAVRDRVMTHLRREALKTAMVNVRTRQAGACCNVPLREHNASSVSTEGRRN